MHPSIPRKVIPALLISCGLAMAPGAGRAEVADLADVPLANSPSDAVLPNLMYILDDSGSMMVDYMPDNVHTTSSLLAVRNCKTASGIASVQCANGSIWPTPTVSDWGEPPYYTAQFNQIYYNPDITYAPGVDSQGLSLGNASPTAAKKDAYIDPTTVDLTSTYPEIYYCSTSSPTAAQLSDPLVCRRNGVNNVTSSGGSARHFLYWSSSTVNGGLPYTGFTNRVIRNTSHPYYFTITPNEYCTDTNLINCQLANADGSAPSGFSIPAPLRYCSSTANASAATAISDLASSATPRCQKNWSSTYTYPRYGRFTRTDITASTTTYPKSATAVRVDCANSAYCTYSEELQNFANWYSYYRTRMAMMKTATGRAFLPIDDRYRVGFITINPGNPVQHSGNAPTDVRYLPIATFNASQRASFYSTLYSQINHGTTPLREALSRVGRHYAAITSGINSGMSTDPVTHSCQQHFALLTTDGYWNDADSAAVDVSNNAVGDQDDTPSAAAPFFVSRPSVTLDGVGTTTTSTVTSTAVEQVVCNGPSNSAVTFSSNPIAGTGTTCGCPTGQKRVKQRTMNLRQITTDNNGVVTTTTSATGTTFQDITACVGTGTAVSFTVNPNPTITQTGSSSTTALGGTPNTLADVAMYYYKNDLRTGTPLSITDNATVKTTDKDIAKHQHMVTFTLGMGLQGLMTYTPDYESNPDSDFAKIKNGDVGTCSWITGRCNWPVPVAGQASTLDDLWHAAVNGRGVYYSASDPNSLADSLAGALSSLQIQTAAASASATSSPNITETDNFIYSSTFRTVKWDGEVVAQRIDTVTGAVLPAVVWSAQAQLDNRVSAASDTRTIYKYDSSVGGTKLEPFTWANLSVGAVGAACSSTAERACFENKCTALSQCSSLNPLQKDVANNGANMVNWLRGQTQHEVTIYRDREHVLGDPANATPAFVKAPKFNFNDSVTPSYGSFRSANGARQGVLYVAANDGMLHAFNADTGAEMWAYIPRIVFKQLHELATDNWDVRHKYTVDGSPQIMDVFDSSASAWKTVLVAGLNKGARGYYALDVTDPASPKALWEICSDATLCEVSDADMGYSYGSPVITKRASDGRWVALVTSGINNVSPGTGRGYLYVLDALTGAILRKVEAVDGSGAGVTTCTLVGFTLVCTTTGGATTFGDTTTPSGFAKISVFANSFNTDNTGLYAYGGDLLGNIWRFDLRVDPPTVLKIGELKDASGKPQSITTKPELGVVQGHRVMYFGTGRYLGEDDLVDPATLSPALQWAYQQSIYAIKDKNVKYDNGSGSSNIRTSSPGLVQQVMTDNGDTRTITSNAVDWTNRDGWYIDLNPGNTSPGERVNLDPQLVLGTLLVVGNVPNNNACTVGGDSWLYQFDFDSGSNVSNSPGGVAGRKKTGQITVGVVVTKHSDKFSTICTGAGGEKCTEPTHVAGPTGAGRRTSWREVIQ